MTASSDLVDRDRMAMELRATAKEVQATTGDSERADRIYRASFDVDRILALESDKAALVEALQYARNLIGPDEHIDATLAKHGDDK